MNNRLFAPLALLAATGMAVAAQAQWAGAGWGSGYGSGIGFGRTEGPVTADVWAVDGGYGVGVTVNGCGGVRDYRSFGTEIVGGDGEVADAAAALGRLLGEARRVCSFEERLGARMAEGFEPGLAAWIEEQAAMYADMSAMDAVQNAADAVEAIDMNATFDCPDDDCSMR